MKIENLWEWLQEGEGPYMASYGECQSTTALNEMSPVYDRSICCYFQLSSLSYVLNSLFLTVIGLDSISNLAQQLPP